MPKVDHLGYAVSNLDGKKRRDGGFAGFPVSGEEGV